MRERGFSFSFPSWFVGYLQLPPQVYPTVEERMRFVIHLAQRNIREKTGGPFGAAVFDGQGRLIAPGVNLVPWAQCSVLHAEMVALMLAQQRVGRFDLSGGGRWFYELVTSSEPCAMCFGALPWAGISRLVCGARDEDARRIGFDEGPKLADWISPLEQRGIRVIRDVLRGEARAVLEEYAATGGLIYNARRKEGEA